MGLSALVNHVHDTYLIALPLSLLSTVCVPHQAFKLDEHLRCHDAEIHHLDKEPKRQKPASLLYHEWQCKVRNVDRAQQHVDCHHLRNASVCFLGQTFFSKHLVGYLGPVALERHCVYLFDLLQVLLQEGRV